MLVIAAVVNLALVDPTTSLVQTAYAAILDGKADSPMAIIDDLVDMEIFERDADKCVPFDQFLDGVVVVSLDAFGQDDRSKNMLAIIQSLARRTDARFDDGFSGWQVGAYATLERAVRRGVVASTGAFVRRDALTGLAALGIELDEGGVMAALAARA